MSTKYSKEGAEKIGRFSVSADGEITVQIAERDGNQFIVIKEQHPSGAASTTEQAVEIPVSSLPELKRAITALEENAGGDGQPTRSDINFAHASEEEFARILDFYHITWQYEPRTFAIEHDIEGNVTKSFTPDFYLPDHDLYIELTTLKQSLVTKKNRKIRLLKEQ